jgi:hypothetical protein
MDGKLIAEGLMASLARTRLAESEDPLEVAQALALQIRVALLLGLERIGAVAGEFPATIQALLSIPAESIEAVRDALVEPQDYLGFLDLLDLLSEEDLGCVSPRLHKGWQDKVQSCREARRLTRGAVGFSIDAAQRESLLLALAVHRRVFCGPPPVHLGLEESRAALKAAGDLIDRLTG